MRLPWISDIPFVYKISLPQALALVVLGSVGAFMVGSQQRQAVVLDGIIHSSSLQTQLAAAERSVNAANREMLETITDEAAGGSHADSQSAIGNVLREVDNVRANIRTFRPEPPNDRQNLAGVSQNLTIYRGEVDAIGSSRDIDFNAAYRLMKPLSATSEKITTALTQIVNGLAATTTDEATKSKTEAGVTGEVMITLIAVTLLLSLTVAPVIITAAQRALLLICEATEALAGGQIDLDLQQLERGDEFGAFGRSLVIFRENQYRIISMRAERETMEAQREATRIDQERITRMISALSETNEAILHAETHGKLFQLVCEAAVLGGRFLGAGIALPDPDGSVLRFVAADGPIGAYFREIEMPLHSAHSERASLTALALNSREPCIRNDCETEGYAIDTPQEGGTSSAAALPLISDGQAVGIMLFLSAERNTFNQAFVELLQRLTRNVTFALENLDRANDKRQSEERIRHLATHDSLTNLPNRVLFKQLVELSIQASTRYQRRFAVLFVDLDRFKLINDSLGHAAGDMLLTEMAKRLRDAVRASDVVARIGGDEFVVLLNEIASADQVEALAAILLGSLGKPIELSGQECRVTASIGIAMYPGDGTDEHTLMKHADSAMYLAKSEGKNGVRVFSNQIIPQSVDRLILESSLRHALERNELCLYYQPKIGVDNEQIAGVEALIRWNHPDLGLVPPGQFIPLAEETDLILAIGSWVIKTACAQNMAWQRQGFAPISMAVNVSPRQFMDNNLLNDIDDALSISGMDPNLLQIEITESMVMLNVERAVQVLDSIHSRGVRLAIDDFGTGYSSMSMLKRFPIDTIKIDQSFVRGLPQNSHDNAITQAIIGMGKALGLTIVAEGVETPEQGRFLRDLRCDQLQGYLFGKPVPADQITGRLRLPVLQRVI